MGGYDLCGICNGNGFSCDFEAEGGLNMTTRSCFGSVHVRSRMVAVAVVMCRSAVVMLMAGHKSLQMQW